MPMSGRPAAVLGVVLAALSAPAAAADGPGSFRAGGWVGEARFNQGYFTHCVMVKQYPGGATLRFAINRGDQMSVGVDDPGWDLSRRREGDLRLQIDTSGALTSDAVTVEHEVSAVFAPDPDLSRRFRSGRTLTATFGQLTATFDLAGTNEALAALGRCTELFK